MLFYNFSAVIVIICITIIVVESICFAVCMKKEKDKNKQNQNSDCELDEKVRCRDHMILYPRLLSVDLHVYVQFCVTIRSSYHQ